MHLTLDGKERGPRVIKRISRKRRSRGLWDVAMVPFANTLGSSPTGGQRVDDEWGVKVARP